MPLLFSYGTLRQENVQFATFGRLLSGRDDALVGYKTEWLEIKDPAVLATSGKTHHPIVRRSDDLRDRVPGTVFDITDKELAHAYRYEVSDYVRVAAPLADGETAWVYVAAGDQ